MEASAGDVDSNGSEDFDRARIAQTFAPKYPCKLGFVAGFYSSEPGSLDALDDFWSFDHEGTPGFAFSAPAVLGSSFPDDGAFDGVPRTVGVGGDLGASLFSSGGLLAGRQLALPIGGGAVPVEISFQVVDQLDWSVDSGLLVDQVRCEETLIFAAGFELGSTIEWDALVGETF